MKKLLFAVAFLTAVNLNAQSPTDVLNEVPASSLVNEQFSLTVGSVMQGAAESFESEVAVRYDVWKHLALSANIQSGKGSSSIDSAALYVQVRKAWDAAELYGFAGGRRNWRDNRFEAVAGVGGTYSPLEGGILSKLKLVVEERVVGASVAGRPFLETFTGVRYSF